jgi:hypothetical protein
MALACHRIDPRERRDRIPGARGRRTAGDDVRFSKAQLPFPPTPAVLACWLWSIVAKPDPEVQRDGHSMTITLFNVVLPGTHSF